MFSDLTYTYLLGASLFFIPWLILFFARQDLRKQMLIAGFWVTLAGLILEYFWWTYDWWRPITITGTRVGIEDVLLGISNGGIAAVIYEEVFHRQEYSFVDHLAKPKALLVMTISAIAFFFSLLILDFTSFWATTAVFIFGGSSILLLRKDLITNALLSGALTLLVSLPIYYVLIWLFPTWVEQTWYTQHLTGINITGIPIEDFAFYFLAGIWLGPFYELWQGKRTRKLALAKVTGKRKYVRSSRKTRQ